MLAISRRERCLDPSARRLPLQTLSCSLNVPRMGRLLSAVFLRRLLFVAVLASCAELAAPAACASLSKADAYLRNRKAIIEAVHRFVGSRRGDYILPNELLVWQFGEGWSGVHDLEEHLAGGRVLMAGCRYHSCPEMAAVIVSKDRKAEALGLIHFHCHYAPKPQWARDYEKKYRERPRRFETCDPTSRLTMFIGASRDVKYDSERLIRWASAQDRPGIPSETILIR